MVAAPTTHDFLQHFRNSFHAGLSAADQKSVRDLYGDVGAPDPVDGSANAEQVSHYLWFTW